MKTAKPGRKGGNPKLGEMAKQRAEYARTLKAKMEEFGCETPEELFAKMAVAAPPVSVSAAEQTVSATLEAPGYDSRNDPCGWAAALDEVYLVGEFTHLAGNIVPTPKGAKPEDIVETLRFYKQADWNHNPNKPVFFDDEERRNYEVQHAKYSCHRLTRHYAERFFESRWSPMPKTVCLRGEDIKSWDKVRRIPIGTKSPSSGDPLVELLRFYLQRYKGQIFVDYAYHRDDIDFSAPNPYGMGRYFVEPVRKFTPEGDSDVPTYGEMPGERRDR